MRLERFLLPPVLLLAGSVARAQSFNVDVGDNVLPFPVPANGYGGAAWQQGYWNDFYSPFTSTMVLSDLGGALTGVGCTSSMTGSLILTPGGLNLDDRALMDDLQRISLLAGTSVWTFSGLANGNYAVYTYAWAADNTSFRTSVDVTGSSDPQQIVGGSWGGSPHALGITYALHHVAVTNGTIVVNCAGAAGTPGSVDGFQLVLLPTFPSFCTGDFSQTGFACPCGNFGALGHGCNNSAATGGARLVASGTTSPDTVSMNSSGQLPTASSILLQGSTILAAPIVFGDGNRCIGGTLKRLYVSAASGGAVSFPPAGGPSISARSAALGDTIASGSARHYQVYYRDANPVFCVPSPSNFNVSNAVTVNW